MRFLKFLSPYFLCFLCFIIFSKKINAQVRCTTEHIGEAIPNTNTVEFNPNIDFRAVVEIPVVVHIVWNSNEENISDEQVFSQIEVLNQDFRATNVELPDIPSVFQSLVADVEFEFCLAKTDPEGNATDGIVRTFTPNTVGIGGSSEIHYSSLGGSDAWDTERYLNIWVAKFVGGIGGIASFPGEGLPEEQGVEINYRQFGTINVELPYHLGRTCTHEVGHFFNLEHPWGPQFDDCCEDDFVMDTPAACDTYLGECPEFPISSCSGPDMFMNYMFYTNDDCMGMFTLGQKERMLATLNGSRSGLLSGEGCMAVATSEKVDYEGLVLYGNPFSEAVKFEIKSKESEKWEAGLYDLFGRRHWHSIVLPEKAIEVPSSGFSSGIYFLEIKNKSYREVHKIVFQK